MTIVFSTSGSTKRTERFLERMRKRDMYKALTVLAQEGVSALESVTSRDSGITADSWDYEIRTGRGGTSITWINTNVVDGFSVAIGLQYGHGTGTGGWVTGVDYINPAIKPVMDKIADGVWKVVTES